MSLLLKYIAEGEGQEQDFKFSIEDQKKISRTLAAFANTDGGRLLIGVKDNGKIAGCNPEEEFHMIQGAAELYVRPALTIESQVNQEGHKLVLEVRVAKMGKGTHQAIGEDGEWSYYHRMQDHTLLVNKIIHRVWKYSSTPMSKPEKMEEESLKILRVMDEEGITLSKIYRKSEVPMKMVDYWIPLFICWGLIEYVYQEPSMLYRLKPMV